jgi:prophage antirepressor-like protein
MNILTQFDFQDNGVRVIIIDSEPWFVAMDVAKILDYTDVRKMVNLVDEEDKQVINPQKLDSSILDESFNSSTFKVSIVNEFGLYAIILGSSKPEAKKFKRWVIAEVIPSIRKTGKYEVNSKPSIDIKQLTAKSHILRRCEEINKQKLPLGHWCIFAEVVGLIADIANQYPVSAYDLVDGSVGLCWSNHRKKLGLPKANTYLHHYPSGDTRGVREANCYLFDELPEFRKWFEEVYRVEKLPPYLKKKYSELTKGS